MQPLDPKQGRPAITNREAGKLIGYYTKHIRQHTKQDMLGVVKQIMALVTKHGLTIPQFVTALENYRDAQIDPKYRKHVRSFFTKDSILAWQNKAKPRFDVQITALDRIADTAPVTAVPAPAFPHKDIDHDDLGEL